MYDYCLDDPIRLADRKGLHPNWAEDEEEEKGFKFGKRPLEGLSSMEVPGLEGLKTLLSFPFLPANGFQNVQGMRKSMEHAREMDDVNNTGAYHKQGFYLDGSGEDAALFPEGGKHVEDIRNYKMEEKEYSAKIMRRAQYSLPDQAYSLLGWFGKKKNNCQDYTDALRGRYAQLKRGDRQR